MPGEYLSQYHETWRDKLARMLLEAKGYGDQMPPEDTLKSVQALTGSTGTGGAGQGLGMGAVDIAAAGAGAPMSLIPGLATSAIPTALDTMGEAEANEALPDPEGSVTGSSWLDSILPGAEAAPLPGGITMPMADETDAVDYIATSGKRKKKGQPQAPERGAEAPAADPYAAMEEIAAKTKSAELKALLGQVRQASELSSKNVPGVKPEEGIRIRQDWANKRDELTKTFMEEAKRLDPGHSTFKQAFPNLAAWSWAVPAAAGLGTGAVVKTGAKLLEQAHNRPWKAALRGYESAMRPSAVAQAMGAKPNPEKALSHAMTVDDFMRGTEKGGTTYDKLLKGVEKGGPAVAGAGAGVEAQFMQDNYDLKNADPEGQEYKDAQGRLSDPVAFGRSLALGGLGGWTGGHLADFATAPLGLGRKPIQESAEAVSRVRGTYDGPTGPAANFRKSLEADAKLKSDIDITPPAPPAPEPKLTATLKDQKALPAPSRKPGGPAVNPAQGTLPLKEPLADPSKGKAAHRVIADIQKQLKAGVAPKDIKIDKLPKGVSKAQFKRKIDLLDSEMGKGKMTPAKLSDYMTQMYDGGIWKKTMPSIGAVGAGSAISHLLGEEDEAY